MIRVQAGPRSLTTKDLDSLPRANDRMFCATSIVNESAVRTLSEIMFRDLKRTLIRDLCAKVSQNVAECIFDGSLDTYPYLVHPSLDYIYVQSQQWFNVKLSVTFMRQPMFKVAHRGFHPGAFTWNWTRELFQRFVLMGHPCGDIRSIENKDATVAYTEAIVKSPSNYCLYLKQEAESWGQRKLFLDRAKQCLSCEITSYLEWLVFTLYDYRLMFSTTSLLSEAFLNPILKQKKFLVAFDIVNVYDDTQKAGCFWPFLAIADLADYDTFMPTITKSFYFDRFFTTMVEHNHAFMEKANNYSSLADTDSRNREFGIITNITRKSLLELLSSDFEA